MVDAGTEIMDLDTDPNRGSAFSRTSQIAWGLMALAVLLRIERYAANSSLWLDEAMLALNISGRSFAALLKPLDFEQRAPIGFLILERLSVVWLGHREMALRLVPMLAAVISVPLFWLVARSTL